MRSSKCDIKQTAKEKRDIIGVPCIQDENVRG